MEVDSSNNGPNGGDSPGFSGDWPGRWAHLSKVFERKGPFISSPNFAAGPELLPLFRENVRVLVIGAGGLGCELLKNLALMGVKNIDVIDMDTIDVSNLNRQFLFRPEDVGSSKAEAAAKFINRRVPGTRVTPHNCKIQDYDEDFYRQFHVIVCGLDSIVARRWINSMVHSMLQYDDETGELDKTTMIPIIDGGTEGFKGNARVIMPGESACMECSLDLYPPQVNFPLCTIAHTPRLPEHCIEYVRVLLWHKENPFGGEGTPIDGDDPQHIGWICEKAQERASQYGIAGVTYRLTQGVIKHIIPAVASTNAVIAAMCALEVVKIATACAEPMNNYLYLEDIDGIYSYAYEQARKEDCLVCNRGTKRLEVKTGDKLKDLLDLLVNKYQMKSPGATTSIGGRNKTLYMSKVASIEEATRPNLKKTLEELGLENGSELVVADPTTPSSVIFKLAFVTSD